MGHSLVHQCGNNVPVVYPDKSSLILIAPPQYWPTYWVAKNRLEPSYFKARKLSNRLSDDVVHKALEQNKQISHSRPWEHDTDDLRDLLSDLIYHERIKVYIMDRVFYERILKTPDSHLSVNCRTAIAQINSGDNSLESQRRELVMELSQILVYRRKDKLRKDDIYWSEDWFTRGLIVTGSVMVSFGDSVIALAKLGKSIAVGLYDSQMYYAKSLYKLSQGEFEAVQKDVARLIGGAIEDTNALEAKIKAGYDILEPILADEPSRQVLYDFLREYVDSTPEVASASFKVEITLEVILIIGTLGSATTVVAARMAHRVGQFTVRALKYIVELSKALRRFNKRRIIEAPPPVSKLPPPKGKSGGGAASSTATKTPEQINDDIIKQVGDEEFTNRPDLPKVNVPDTYVQESPIDFDHVLKSDYNKKGKPTGGHTLLYGDVRIVPGTESVSDVAGVYKATIQVPDLANPGQWITKTSSKSTNTMFPKAWDETRIKTEVDAAWKNPNKIIQGDKWISVTPSGVKVEGWTSPRVTAYPIYQTPKIL